jgi:hypothetical protein
VLFGTTKDSCSLEQQKILALWNNKKFMLFGTTKDSGQN